MNPSIQEVEQKGQVKMTTVAKGRIVQLVASSSMLKIEIDQGPFPKGKLFQLRGDHDNYESIATLATIAMVTQQTVKLDCDKHIVPNLVALVLRIRVFQD